jgi:hypothetical protein
MMSLRLEEPRDRERSRHLRVGQVSFHSNRARYAQERRTSGTTSRGRPVELDEVYSSPLVCLKAEDSTAPEVKRTSRCVNESAAETTRPTLGPQQ